MLGSETCVKQKCPAPLVKTTFQGFWSSGFCQTMLSVKNSSTRAPPIGTPLFASLTMPQTCAPSVMRSSISPVLSP